MALKCQQNTRVQIFHSFTVLLKLLNINIIITNKSLFLEQNTYCCTVDLYRCFTIHKFHSEVAAQQFNIDRFLFRDNANHHIHLSVIFKHTSFFFTQQGHIPRKAVGIDTADQIPFDCPINSRSELLGTTFGCYKVQPFQMVC